jgi:hypothetical protein
MKPFHRVVNPGLTEYGLLFVIVSYNKIGQLSIVGVEGPKANGNSKGGSGQRADALKQIKTYSEGWSAESADKLFEVWERWHLNDLRAGCEHQRRDGWMADRLEEACPGCGYRFGTAWLFEEVPEEVLQWLSTLPSGPNKLPSAWASLT